jgi:hypothetical protein
MLPFLLLVVTDEGTGCMPILDCPKCGAVYTFEIGRCRRCGTAIERPALIPKALLAHPPARRLRWVILTTVVIVASLGGVGFLWLRPSDTAAVKGVIERYYQAVRARDPARVVACLRSAGTTSHPSSNRLARFLSQSQFIPTVESMKIVTVNFPAANRAEATIEERSRLLARDASLHLHTLVLVEFQGEWLIDPYRSALDPRTVLPSDLEDFGKVRRWFAAAGPGVLAAYVIATNDSLRRRFAQALVEHERRRQAGMPYP